jgi:hypothetical protein
MKSLLLFLEYCGGLLVALLTVVTIAIGGLIGLTEIPRYLRRQRGK